jgi:hypothetical protein
MIKIWVGKRESDILTYPYFDFSITFWGSNNNTNFSFCKKKRILSNYSNEFTMFVIDKLQYIVKKTDGKCQVFFYNNTFAYKIINIEDSLKPYIQNLNSVYTHNILRHKTLSRLWLSNSVDVPAFASLSKHECEYEHLQKLFPDYNNFIIQENYSGGGDGTYIITKKNIDNVLTQLSAYKTYLVSPYYEKNISLSCTLLIDNCTCVIFPISQQLLIFDDHIRYCGNHYYKNDEEISICAKAKARCVGDTLRYIGYRGVCGLDWIYTDEKLLLIEVNPRFQGSSFSINEALKRYGIPSLFELNSNCFVNEIPLTIKESIDNISIPFDNYCVFHNQTPVNNKPTDMIFYDGYDKAEIFEKGVYLYRYITI